MRRAALLWLAGAVAVSLLAAGCFEVKNFSPRATDAEMGGMGGSGNPDGATGGSAGPDRPVLSHDGAVALDCATPACPSPVDQSVPPNDGGPVPTDVAVVSDRGPDAPATECRASAELPCWPPEFPTQRFVGACRDGRQTCGPDGHWGTCEGAVVPVPEVRGNDVDEDCDGVATPWETIVIQKPNEDDCETLCCPPTHPFPVGCQFHVSSDLGCVAWPGAECVFVKEGDYCYSGHVTGTLTCSEGPGVALDGTNCTIDCPDYRLVASEGECP